MIRPGLAFLLLVPTSALAQAPPTLAGYLRANPIEGGLAVDAENVRATVPGGGLGRFERKSMTVGGITAIVPLTMVRIDDSLKEPPNLYDGLPRNDKVLYLMSTLTAGQWRLAGGTRGIGLNDLGADQRNVFLSLLPKPMRWTRHRVGPKRYAGSETGQGNLDERESQGVRLRIERQMRFLVPLANEENAYTFATPDDEHGQPGEEIFRRDQAADRDPKTLFGIEVRTVVPNAPKKGQLDTSGLNATVTLPAQTTVGKALGQVGSATGREILADVRVRDLSVTFPIGKARAGDLLDALALAVSGAYRRVGGSYLLAADVTGLGARKLKFSIWQEEVEAVVAERILEWRRSLAESGLAEAAKFEATDPLAPGPDVQKRLNRSPYETPREQFFPVEELSAEQRAFLSRQADSRPNQPVRRDKIGVAATLLYRFILPNGTRLQSEGYLGEDWQFKNFPLPRPMGPDPAVPIATNPEGALRPLAVRLANPAEATRAAALARAFGFTELWVQTTQPSVLPAAVAQGLPVRLFARPWALDAPRPDSDRTILGETGRGVLPRMATSRGWGRVLSMVRMQSWPRLGPVTVDGDVLSPLDPQWPEVRNRLVALAQTPGLAGVVLADAMPHGYEAKDNTMMVGAYARTSNDLWAFGYDERMRLAFLREKGADPIDLTHDQLPFEIDLYSPFFVRYPPSRVPVMDNLYADWIRFRSQANVDALKELRAALPDLPVHIDVRRAFLALPPLSSAILRPWPRGAQLPSYEEQYVPPAEGDFRLVAAPTPKNADALADFGNAVKVFGTRKERDPVVDLTRIPAAQWEEMLGHWFTRKG